VFAANDPSNDKFLECADAARADYLITGNLRHFPRFWKSTKVVTAREFIGIAAPAFGRVRSLDGSKGISRFGKTGAEATKE
jgi:hypothetical protein